MKASTQTTSADTGPTLQKKTTMLRVLTLTALLVSISAAMAVYVAIFQFREHRMPTFIQSSPPVLEVAGIDSVYRVEYRVTTFNRDSTNNDLILYLEDGSHQIAKQLSKEQIRYIEKVYGAKDWYFDKKGYGVVTRDKD